MTSQFFVLYNPIREFVLVPVIVWEMSLINVLSASMDVYVFFNLYLDLTHKQFYFILFFVYK